MSSGLLTPSQTLLFELANMGGIIVLVLAVPFWGTIYLAGWLFGLIIMAHAGLVGILELIVYFGIPLMILLVRIFRWLTC